MNILIGAPIFYPIWSILPISMVKASDIGAKGAASNVQVAQAEAPDFEKVNWRREPHLRKLYAMGVVLMVASATTGYDGFAALSCKRKTSTNHPTECLSTLLSRSHFGRNTSLKFRTTTSSVSWSTCSTSDQSLASSSRPILLTDGVVNLL